MTDPDIDSLRVLLRTTEHQVGDTLQVLAPSRPGPLWEAWDLLEAAGWTDCQRFVDIWGLGEGVEVWEFVKGSFVEVGQAPKPAGRAAASTVLWLHHIPFNWAGGQAAGYLFVEENDVDRVRELLERLEPGLMTIYSD